MINIMTKVITSVVSDNTNILKVVLWCRGKIKHLGKYEEEFPLNLFRFQIGVESWKTNSNLRDVSGMSVAV